MALTQQDILALKELLLPPITAQISDLKDAMTANAEAHRVENERRRDDVGNLYEKDRLRSSEHAELVSRVVALEEWRQGHTKAEDAQADGQKFTTSQRWVAVGIALTALLWISDKLIELIGKLGGK